MVENRELQSLERRIDSLEKQLEQDRRHIEEEKERARKEKDRRWHRRMEWSMWVWWTLYVAALTTLIVLSATGNLHHH
jgi:predicted RNase H-like nuclease (RuvC/YqgF family)